MGVDLSQYLDDIDDRSVAASTGIPDPVPPGEYTLMVDKTEVAQTKAGNGVLLKVQYTICDGEYEGRKVFAQFNIRNQSAQAQAIGIGELKALCISCGIDYEQVRTDTDALVYHPFRATIGMEREQINPATGQPYAPRNRIMRYIPRGDMEPAKNLAHEKAAGGMPMPKQQPAPQRPAAPQRNAMKPWQKGDATAAR